MTYMFEFVVPHVQEGTPEAEKEIQKFKGVSTCSSVETARMRRACVRSVANQVTDGKESGREQY